MEKNQTLWEPTPDYLTGCLRMIYSVSTSNTCVYTWNGIKIDKLACFPRVSVITVPKTARMASSCLCDHHNKKYMKNRWTVCEHLCDFLRSVHQIWSFCVTAAHQFYFQLFSTVPFSVHKESEEKKED